MREALEALARPEAAPPDRDAVAVREQRVDRPVAQLLPEPLVVAGGPVAVAAREPVLTPALARDGRASARARPREDVDDVVPRAGRRRPDLEPAQRFASLSSQRPDTSDQNSGCGRKPIDS